MWYSQCEVVAFFVELFSVSSPQMKMKGMSPLPRKLYPFCGQESLQWHPMITSSSCRSWAVHEISVWGRCSGLFLTKRIGHRWWDVICKMRWKRSLCLLRCPILLSPGSFSPGEVRCHIMQPPYGEIHVVRDQGLPAMKVILEEESPTTPLKPEMRLQP